MLRRRLFDLRWTQTKLAEAIGVSSGIVSRWISGERTPTIEMAFRIQKAVGLPIEIWRTHRSAA